MNFTNCDGRCLNCNCSVKQNLIKNLDKKIEELTDKLNCYSGLIAELMNLRPISPEIVKQLDDILTNKAKWDENSKRTIESYTGLLKEIRLLKAQQLNMSSPND